MDENMKATNRNLIRAKAEAGISYLDSLHAFDRAVDEVGKKAAERDTAFERIVNLNGPEFANTFRRIVGG